MGAYSMVNAAIIGFGEIAKKVHLPAFKILEGKGKARLVSVFDISLGMEHFDFNIYSDLNKMLENEDIDLIDICLPTYLHTEFIIDMLKRGYHVFCEKPMALNTIECERILTESKKAKGKLMVGHCLRFSEEYLYLKNIVQYKTFGKPLSAVFRRYNSPPLWADWLLNIEKSGGCLLDLHIHDIDIIRFIFGEPYAVSCATSNIYTVDDVVFSFLYYEDITVLAIADWTQQGMTFTSDYRIGFERSTVIYDNRKIKIYPRNGISWEASLDNKDMYLQEIEYFVDTICFNAINTQNPPESSATTIKVIEALRKSARNKGEKIFL